MTASRPLAGLRIAVTRPCAQASALAQQITDSGGQPILFPLLEIGPPPDPRPLRDIVARLANFNLAIFISPTAVDYGMAALQAAGPLPLSLRIAAVGQGSAIALRKAGIGEILAPADQFDSEHLLALSELQEVRGWRVVIFRGENGREVLGDTLKSRGAEVEYVACYRRTGPPQAAGALLAARPDALTVTSSEALRYLWDMADEAEKAQLAMLPLFAPHERIAATARMLGWRKAVATAGGDAGLLGGLIAWAASR